MRKFQLFATASGFGSTLIDTDSGLKLDGITRIEVVVRAGEATKVTITMLGEVDAAIESDVVEIKGRSSA